MGFFSHRCAISNESIPAYPYAEFDKVESEVVLILPSNFKINGTYDGYGRVLSDSELTYDYAQMQDISNLMDLIPDALILNGMPFEVDETEGYTFETIMQNVKMVKKTYYNGEDFNDLPTSPNCEYQGFFYPAYFSFAKDAENYIEAQRDKLEKEGIIPPVID